MSAESLPAALARLIGQHPAALRAVRWVTQPPTDPSPDYLEIETKHGLVVVIDPASGTVSADPPRPAHVPTAAVRLQQDLTERVRVAFDGRPVFSAIVRTPAGGCRFELSTGAVITLTPEAVVPLCAEPVPARPA